MLHFFGRLTAKMNLFTVSQEKLPLSLNGHKLLHFLLHEWVLVFNVAYMRGGNVTGQSDRTERMSHPD